MDDDLTPDQQVGVRLRGVRELNKLTQAGLAEAVRPYAPNLTAEMIGKIERGGRSLSFLEANALSFVLCVDIQSLTPETRPESLLAKARLHLVRLDKSAKAVFREIADFGCAWEDVGNAIRAYRAEARRVGDENLPDDLLALKEEEQRILNETHPFLGDLEESIEAAVESWDEDMDDMCEDLAGPDATEEFDADYEIGEAIPLGTVEARIVGEGHEHGEEVRWPGGHSQYVLTEPDQWANLSTHSPQFFARLQEIYEQFLAQPEVLSAAAEDWVGMRITMPRMYSTFLMATRTIPGAIGESTMVTMLREDKTAGREAVRSAMAAEKKRRADQSVGETADDTHHNEESE